MSICCEFVFSSDLFSFTLFIFNIYIACVCDTSVYKCLVTVATKWPSGRKERRGLVDRYGMRRRWIGALTEEN